MQVLTQRLGIKQLFTSPYHPQTNGLTEHLNRTIKQMLSASVDPLHQELDQVLPFVAYAYNTSVQAPSRISPFRALDGRDPKLPPDTILAIQKPKYRDVVEWWTYLQQTVPLLQHSARHNLRLAQQRQKRIYDKGHQTVTYKEGDQVLLYFPIRRA